MKYEPEELKTYHIFEYFGDDPNRWHMDTVKADSKEGAICEYHQIRPDELDDWPEYRNTIVECET